MTHFNRLQVAIAADNAGLSGFHKTVFINKMIDGSAQEALDKMLDKLSTTKTSPVKSATLKALRDLQVQLQA